MVAHEALQVAIDRQAEEHKMFIKAIEVAVQNGVARAFGGKG